MSLREDIVAIGEKAGRARSELLRLNARKKNVILRAMADELEVRAKIILTANAADIADAGQEGLSVKALDRLQLSPQHVAAMVKTLRGVADLKDPIGTGICRWIRPNGLEIIKQRVPIGVVAVIFEARPTVTASVTAFCVKTANALVLRGEAAAARTNAAITEAMIAGGKARGLPDYAVQMVPATDPAAIDELVSLDGYIDLVVPRGGDKLVRRVMEKATVPVLTQERGLCHTYVDEAADIPMALAICQNAKCQRPRACNAMETLLVHEKIAPFFLPAVVAQLSKRGVQFYGDDAARALAPGIAAAAEDDWYAEYQDLRLSVRVVHSVEDAIRHINTYGSRHSDAIVSENEAVQKAFELEVDSAAVFINSSTRFNDGASFGMGAEIGVSTSKLHARGPMGLEELTTYKYIVHGTGQVRES